MRQLGKPAIVGARKILIDSVKKDLRTVDGEPLAIEGDEITIDGFSGLIYRGALPLKMNALSDSVKTILNWADKFKTVHVLANADSAQEARKALDLGAEGVGCCRTDRMLMKSDRINHIRYILLFNEEKDRKEYITSLLPLLQSDYVDLLRVMSYHPVAIQLMDCRIDDFLPNPAREDFDDKVEKLAEELSLGIYFIKQRILELQECSPMLGFNGTRKAIVCPEFCEMQLRAMIGMH